MSLPPQEYANFVIGMVAVCLLLGLFIGYAIGLAERPEGCTSCARLVDEHVRAMRAGNRIRSAAGQAERDLHDQFESDVDFEDESDDWDRWEDSHAR